MIAILSNYSRTVIITKGIGLKNNKHYIYLRKCISSCRIGFGCRAECRLRRLALLRLLRFERPVFICSRLYFAVLTTLFERNIFPAVPKWAGALIFAFQEVFAVSEREG
ncbi:conserved hypothetical protein [Trichinella spiralis]|uniref:hypothetical protein n=1 Tax=Trichinella spiralis TaxID=6334 RepID=UPI0001EFD513|nr:conserved hypothetical protein [Trichinella spiralis]